MFARLGVVVAVVGDVDGVTEVADSGWVLLLVLGVVGVVARVGVVVAVVAEHAQKREGGVSGRLVSAVG